MLHNGYPVVWQFELDQCFSHPLFQSPSQSVPSLIHCTETGVFIANCFYTIQIKTLEVFCSRTSLEKYAKLHSPHLFAFNRLVQTFRAPT